MRSFMTALITCTLVCTLTSLAYAAPRIVTPRLFPPANGFLRCNIVNASATRTLEMRVTIFDFNATAVSGPFDFILLPNESSVLSTNLDNARHCVVEVKKGGKRNARVSLSSVDSNFEPIAAVNGF